MFTSSTRLMLLWAYAVMICLPMLVSAQTELQKASDYCSVTYLNGCTGNNGLSSVQINDVAMSQNSGCSVSGYGQFTTTSARLTPGQTNTFAITLLDPTRPHGITIWADLNRNYSIDLGEDLYLSNGPLTGPISGTFTIPSGTASGPLRMRVLSAYNTMPFWPCSTNNGSPIIYEAGETEDYTVYVQGPITGLTTTNITGNYAQFNWNSLGPGVNYDVQWRQQGTATWSTGDAFTNTFQAYLGKLNTASEWQVRQKGTQTFSGPVSFTTLCTPPFYTSATPYRAVANLYWESSYGPTFTIHWRAAGNTDWTTVYPSTSLIGNQYSLTGLTANTAYEWQMQTHCSASVSSTFTAVKSFTTLSCQAPANPSVNNLLSNVAYLGWSAPTDPGRTFRLQYRPVGNPAWQTVESLTTTGYSLTALTPNTSYEWQVQSVCSPTESTSYTPGPVFTPVCPVPYQPSGNPTATGASISWQINPAETVNTFTLQYRQAGTADWTTVSSLTPAAYSSYRSYTLTELSRNTGYEWRLQTNCAFGTQSDYTPILSFTTVCSPAYAAYTASESSTSTRLIWSVHTDADTRFEIRWRPTGTPDWTTISNLTISQGQGRYLLTGLTINTPYEWQVRTICSPTESSSFAIGEPFTPRCPIPFIYSWQSGVPKVTSATLQWERTFTLAQYEVYYRPIGSANWAILSNINSTSAVLTNLQSSTPYEWQVQTLCDNGLGSGFSEVRSFTTLSCIIPAGSTPVIASDNSANLSWTYYVADADTRFDIRWRATGAPDWTTISNLTASDNGLFSLTGLTPNTAYEWQIRARCSATLLTDFSASVNFQTLPPCNGVVYTLRHGSWLEPSTWSCNRIPLPTDVVQIRHNVFFYINQVGNALRVQFEGGGKIYYSANSRLRLGL